MKRYSNTTLNLFVIRGIIQDIIGCTIRCTIRCIIRCAIGCIVGCIVGSTGGCAGAAGTSGINNKIASNIICSATIADLSSDAGTALNGIVVTYKAYITTAGDVMATAAINNHQNQISATSLFSASQISAATASITLTDDLSGTPNDGSWVISVNRSTHVMTAIYTDEDLVGQTPVTIEFAESNCTPTTF